MSALASFLQNELLTLSNEARRKHPEIKEAAERLLYILRALKDRPNPPPTEDGDIVAIELAKTEEVLRPFLMSCETKNPKLVPIAVGCLQRLITHHAIPEGSIMIVLKTLSENVHGSVELQLKILQTVLPLLTNYRNIHGEVLAEALLLCFRLQETKSPIVKNTAAATVRQLVTFVFEKVSTENEAASVESGQKISGARQLTLSGQDAVLLIKDLCLLSSGETASFLPLQALPKTFGLELIEAVISHHPQLFKELPDLSNLMKERVCPLIIKSFSDRLDFPLSCRLMRLVHVIIKQYHDLLMMECEIFLSMFCRLLEPDHAPLWHRVFIMEVFKSLCTDAALLRFIFRSYDEKEHTTKVFTEMITAFRRIIVAEKPALLLHPPPLSVPESADMEPEEQYSLTVSSAQMKLQCLDQLDKAEPPPIPETYIIYLGIQCMNSVVESEAQFALPLLSQASTPTEQKEDIILAIEMANASWAGILAALSFLVTSSIDDEIFAMVIRAYQSITSVVGLLGLSSHRDAFLASLIKSCLPASASGDISTPTKGEPGQGIHPASLQAASRATVLTDRNVLCLRALIYVANSLTPVLEDKAWYMIMETLQVSDKYLAMGKTGRRDQSSMALLGESREGRMRSGSVASPPRAVVSGMENQFVTLLMSTKKLFESTVSMDERNLVEFLRALCQLAQSAVVGSASFPTAAGGTGKDTSMKVADEKSFALTKIHDVGLLNVVRLINSPDLALWDLVIGELVDIAHSPACAPTIRTQACQAFGDILVAAVQAANIKNVVVEKKLLEPLRRLTLIEGSPVSGATNSAAESEDRDKITRATWFVEVQKFGLETINKLLQTSGQHLSGGWPLILDIIRTVVSSRIRKTRVNDLKAGPEMTAHDSTPQAAVDTATVKAPGLVRVAFPCLQLICTDFLSVLSPQVLHQCIETLGSFGSQADDLNISLTAIGLLWSVCDFVLTKRQDLEKSEGTQSEQEQQSEAPDIQAAPPELSSQTSVFSMKRSASTCIAILDEPLSPRTMDALWMLLLGHLSQLCSDPRPEVRNSANQTLFRTIGMNGGKLTMEAWEQCIWDVLFPLLKRVQASSEVDSARGLPTAIGSTDINRSSPSKQWDETKVITLSGISKSLLDFLPVLVDLGEGFDRAWALFLDYIKSWCLGGSPEVSMAAVKSLRSLVQYPKNVGEAGIPENVQNRLMHLMRVAWDVWEGMGEGIIAGADENVTLSAPGSADGPSPVVITTPLASPKVLHGFFTQDTLTIYVSIFADIYDVVRPSFGLFEMRQLLGLLSRLLLYHTNPQPGATASRIRADLINDLDTPTPLQFSILDLIAGGKLDIDNIEGAPELVLTTVAGLVKLPFVRGPASSTSPRDSAAQLTPTTAVAEDKGFTYMALSKKSMQALVELCERYAKLKTVYSSGPFEAIIEALGLPMRAKYDCPSPGVKDTTPLWRAAANTCMTVARIGLDALNGFVGELPQEVSDNIYEKLLDTFEGVLLPASEPPAGLSQEELSADEAFDISVLTTIESDVFPHMGQPHTSEKLLRRLVEIIANGSRLYTTPLEAAGYGRIEEITNGAANGGSMEWVAVGEDAGLADLTGVVGSAPRPEAVKLNRESPAAVSIVGPKAYTLGSDVIAVGRERFAVSCLETLFRLCSDSDDDNAPMRFRIAEIVAPVMVEKCKHVMRRYTADRPKYGQLPLPRLRNDELVLVMMQLQTLQIRPGVLVRYLGQDKLHPLRSYILGGKSAHLFAVYPLMCDLMAVVVSSGLDGRDTVGGGESAVVQSVRECLRRIGQEMGIE